MPINEIIQEIQEKYGIIGRERELRMIIISHKAGKNILLEGEIGVGKTCLARAIANYFDKNFHRVEGTEDLYSTTLIGTWQPPILIKKGYCEEAFQYGPLSLAMKEGGCLFINEINRAPESTQNLLLTAMDEGILEIPNLETVQAKDGFFVVATRNPASHIGVSVLGEALKDRFVLVKLEYQSFDEEVRIVQLHTGSRNEALLKAAVRVTRATRNNKDIRRGASVRGAIDIVSMMSVSDNRDDPFTDQELWVEVCIAALATKVEIEEGTGKTPEEVITLLARKSLSVGGEEGNFFR